MLQRIYYYFSDLYWSFRDGVIAFISKLFSGIYNFFMSIFMKIFAKPGIFLIRFVISLLRSFLNFFWFLKPIYNIIIVYPIKYTYIFFISILLYSYKIIYILYIVLNSIFLFFENIVLIVVYNILFLYHRFTRYRAKSYNFLYKLFYFKRLKLYFGSPFLFVFFTLLSTYLLAWYMQEVTLPICHYIWMERSIWARSYTIFFVFSYSPIFYYFFVSNKTNIWVKNSWFYYFALMFANWSINSWNTKFFIRKRDYTAPYFDYCVYFLDKSEEWFIQFFDVFNTYILQYIFIIIEIIKNIFS